MYRLMIIPMAKPPAVYNTWLKVVEFITKVPAKNREPALSQS